MQFIQRVAAPATRMMRSPNCRVPAAMFATAAAASIGAPEAFGRAAKDVKETIDVAGDGKLQKLVLQQGAGETPKRGDTLLAHYDGRLTSGKQFDSSRKRNEPFQFTVGAGQVIEGWDRGFATMKKGEKSILVIDSKYGYGARGAGGVIPPNATLYFEVELLDIHGRR
eukprot:TRINITY_DN18977_c0_g1_i1.p1 TRINITY_DN18977_c0_g1~~TRINITY_DN18977_c0_g1_i1.p1  ORF type:complete len:168 (-),score=63.99 TRINITY_DN18977_c0_g1_i1:183-686(-)